jgi:hypothetical protein
MITESTGQHAPIYVPLELWFASLDGIKPKSEAYPLAWLHHARQANYYSTHATDVEIAAARADLPEDERARLEAAEADWRAGKTVDLYQLRAPEPPGIAKAEKRLDDLFGLAEKHKVAGRLGLKPGNDIGEGNELLEQIDVAPWYIPHQPRDDAQPDAQPQRTRKTNGAAVLTKSAARPQAQSNAVVTSLEALATRKVEPVPWTVEGMAAPGALLVVGRPKGGKSLLTTDMVFAVAGGTELLGRKCAKGEVLWIAAEDDADQLARRIQRRVPDAQVPAGVIVLTGEQLVAMSAQSEPEDGGRTKMMLHQYVDSYLKHHPQCRLVIIDTQATAEARWGGDSAADSELKRSKSVVRSAYAGARVYQDVGLARGACIVLVSHSRKRNGKDVSDYHELINMPQTVVAGVTSSVVLADLPNSDPHEPSAKRVLAVRGRHAPDSTQIVTLGASLTFTLDGDYRDVTRSAMRVEIMESIEALQGAGEGLVSLGDVAAEVGSTVGSIKATLSQMRKTPDGLRWKGRVLESKPGKGGGVRFVLEGAQKAQVP